VGLRVLVRVLELEGKNSISYLRPVNLNKKVVARVIIVEAELYIKKRLEILKGTNFL
jgi:hypothetical protein